MIPTPRPAASPWASPATRWAAVGLGSLALGAAALLYLHRPDGQFFFPRCTFHQATGLLCPGCGGLRASHELLHGRFLEAARCNLLFVAGTPLAVLAWVWKLRQPGGLRIGSRAVWILFAVAAAFTVVRNLPIPAARWLCP